MIRTRRQKLSVQTEGEKASQVSWSRQLSGWAQKEEGPGVGASQWGEECAEGLAGNRQCG